MSRLKAGTGEKEGLVRYSNRKPHKIPGALNWPRNAQSQLGPAGTRNHCKKTRWKELLFQHRITRSPRYRVKGDGSENQKYTYS